LPEINKTYPMTAPTKQGYSSQLSEFQWLKRVSKDILDSEQRASLPKRPWLDESGSMTCVGQVTK